MKEKKIPAMKWEEVRRKKARSYIQAEITEGDVEEWIFGEAVVDVEWLLSLSRMRWARAFVQVSWALFGADQGRRDEEYTVDLCTKCFLA